MSFHDFTLSGTRDTRATVTTEMIHALKAEWQDYQRKVSPYPGTFKGRGIVICAGGIEYFTCAWVNIKVLRDHGCTLPVEVWYYGDELNETVISMLTPLNVQCKNFLDYGIAANVGFMLKPLAIMHSAFEEVLYLDADNVCTTAPSYLFEDEGYLKNGAMFWPDFWKISPLNPMWQITGTHPELLEEQESGQLLIDKKACWEALNLCVFFNLNSFIYYRFLMGDKDTFKFAWLALRTPFYWISTLPSSCGYIQHGNFYGMTMVQHDTSGKQLFMHRNLCKWNYTPNGIRMWQHVKSFNTPGQLTIDESPNRHGYVDMTGDTITVPFDSQLEDVCMSHLEELRNADFYKRFVSATAFNKRAK